MRYRSAILLASAALLAAGPATYTTEPKEFVPPDEPKGLSEVQRRAQEKRLRKVAKQRAERVRKGNK